MTFPHAAKLVKMKNPPGMPGVGHGIVLAPGTISAA
jgi:hypothetical protein